MFHKSHANHEDAVALINPLSGLSNNYFFKKHGNQEKNFPCYSHEPSSSSTEATVQLRAMEGA